MSKRKSSKLKDLELELGEFPLFLMAFGLRHLREAWYVNCAEELAREEDKCTAKYDPLTREWIECMNAALWKYYHCTEDAPKSPFEVPSD